MRRLFPPPVRPAVGGSTPIGEGPSDEVLADELDDEALLHEYAYPEGHSWLRANMIGAVDGVATVQGLSGGLSGAADRRVFSILRGLADVVIAGAGTARTENYRGARTQERFAGLRASRGQAPVPTIAIVSRRLGLDPGAGLFTDTSVRPLIVTCEAADQDRVDALTDVADIVRCGDTDVDLVAARAALEERGLIRMLCEGGPSLLHDVAAAGILDELCLSVSPQLVGGGERHLLNGEAFEAPVALHLVAALEDDGLLLNRYLVRRT